MKNTYSILTLILLIKNILADSICGNNQRFMVALTCGDGNTTLHCAPNNLKDRTQFCTNPNEKWAKAKCNNKGGLTSIDIDNTGCYTLYQSYWGGSELNCDNTYVLPEVSTNYGFELGTLEEWEYTGPSAPVVQCDSTAPEGNCYVVLSTYGTSPWTGPNVISTDKLTMSNNGGCNNDDYKLTFFYKFTAGDYVPFNDYLQINVFDEFNALIFTQTLDVATVGDFGSSDWLSAEVLLGKVPIGTSLSINLVATTSNTLDGALQSYGYLDGFQIVKV